VRRGAFQTWAETTSLIDNEVNGDLNFMNVETVVTDRNDLPRDTKGQSGPFNFRTHPNGIPISSRAASTSCPSPTTTRWTTAWRGSSKR